MQKIFYILSFLFPYKVVCFNTKFVSFDETFVVLSSFIRNTTTEPNVTNKPLAGRFDYKKNIIRFSVDKSYTWISTGVFICEIIDNNSIKIKLRGKVPYLILTCIIIFPFL